MKRRLQTLERRIAHLDERLTKGEAAGVDLSFDKAERSALRWAVDALTALDGRVDKLESDHAEATEILIRVRRYCEPDGISKNPLGWATQQDVCQFVDTRGLAIPPPSADDPVDAGVLDEKPPENAFYCHVSKYQGGPRKDQHSWYLKDSKTYCKRCGYVLGEPVPPADGEGDR